MGKVFLRCHQMKYYDRVDWNLPKTQDWEKVLAVLYPSLGTLGLSFPIHKKAVGWGWGSSIPKDLEALTFPVLVTIGKSSKQKKFQLSEAAFGTHRLSSKQALWHFWAAWAGSEPPWVHGTRWLQFWPGPCHVGVMNSCCKVYVADFKKYLPKIIKDFN